MQGTLVGKLVTLHVLRKQYISDYLAMFSSRVQQLLHVHNKYSEYEYVHTCLERLEQGHTLFYCIFDNEDQRLIGALEIRHTHEQRGQLYSWLHEAYWGSGRYQEALTLISAEYFRVFNTIAFNAHVDITNERSYRALRKFGCAHAGFYNGPHGRQYRLIIRKRG